jgi:protoporphyrinogen oxidase
MDGVTLEEFDTLVVGAGVSGLAAAHDLHHAGQKVMVVESSNRSGGRVARIEHRGDMAEAGAQGYFDNYTQAMELLAHYGLDGDLRASGGKTLYLMPDGSRRSVASNFDLLKLLGVRGALDLARFYFRYVRRRPSFSPFEIAEPVPQSDAVSAATEFTWAGRAFRDLVLRPMTHMMTTSALEETGLYYFLNVLSQSTHKTYYLLGGNARLAEKMAQALPVRYGTAVESLHMSDSEIAGVELDDGSILKARHVILACPAGAASKILPAEFGGLKAFLGDFPHTRYALVYFFLNGPLVEDAFFFCGHPNRETIFNAAINHSVSTPEHVPSGRALISAWAAFPDSERIALWSDAAVVDRARQDLRPLIPGLEGKIEHVAVVRHDWGVARYDPGMYRRITAFKAQAEGVRGLSFAGTDFDCPHMEGGIRSGKRAAARAMRPTL